MPKFATPEYLDTKVVSKCTYVEGTVYHPYPHGEVIGDECQHRYARRDL